MNNNSNNNQSQTGSNVVNNNQSQYSSNAIINEQSQYSTNNNDDSNNKESKKNNKKLFLIIIALVVVIIGIIVLVSISDKKNNTINKENNDSVKENINSSRFVSMETNSGIMGKYFIGLTANGDMYQVGKLAFGGEEYKKITKIATNVKKAIYDSYMLYINNKDELYHMGLGLNGGTTKQFEKIFDNASDVATNGFTVFVVDNNNNLYVRHNSFDKTFTAGFNEYYTSEFVKVKENVKIAYPGMSNYYYITSDNKLYENNGVTDSLIMENVKEISDYSNGSKIIILDNNNVAHHYTNSTKEIVKLLDNVISINNNYMIDKNNNAYKVDVNSKTGEFKKIQEIKNVSFVNNYGRYTKTGADFYIEAKYIDLDGKIHYYIDGKETVYDINNIDKLISDSDTTK